MQTIHFLKFAAVIGWILVTSSLSGQTVTWSRQAYGQQQNYPCGEGTFNWPDDNSWDIGEIDDIDPLCNQSYVAQPSNWSTPNYPDGPTFDVILTAATGPTSLDIATTLHSLTVQSGAGDINMTSGSSFDVQNYDFQTDGTFTTSLNHGHGGATPIIEVAGVFLKSAGPGILDISGHVTGSEIYFNMQGGTVQVTSGTLKLSRGESTGATFTIGANGVVDLTNGSVFVNWTGAYGGSGPGAVQLNNGGISIQNPGATFDFSGGLFQWSGGSIYAGGNSPLLTNVGTINLVGSGNKEIDGGGFHNAGLITQTGTGNLQFGGNSSMTNDANGTYDIRSDSGVENGGEIENYGTFKKSDSTGVSSIGGPNADCYFELLGGTVEVDSGTLKLGRSYGANQGSTGGRFIVAAGAVLDLNGAASYPNGNNYSGTYTGSGAGVVQLTSGFNAASPGVTFNLSGSLFQWVGGYISSGGSATFTNSGTMTLSGSGNKEIDGGGFYNAGTMIQTDTGNLQFGGNSFMTNAANGTYDLRSDAGFSNGQFENYGTFKKSAGTGISKLFGNNDPNSTYFDLLGGTVEVDTGTLMLGRCYTGTGATFIVAAGAVLDLNSGGIYGNYTGAYTGTGAGTLQMTGGQIYVYGPPSASFNFTGNLFQWSGGTIVHASNDEFDNNGTINIAGNVAWGGYGMTNNGTIKGNGSVQFTGSPSSLMNNGTIAPGNSAGRLDIGFYNGGLTLGPTSNLVFEVGGTTQGVNYDWLNRTDNGTQTLAGTLTVRLINGFIPQNSDIFTIVTTQQILQGAFANVANGARLNTADGGGSFKVTYNVINQPLLSRNVTLSDFQPIPVGWTLVDVADFNRDGKSDYLLFNATTRQTAIWYMNNSIRIGAVYGPTLSAGWQLVAAADLNRDGKPDFVLYKVSTRQTAIWYLNNNVFVSGAYGPTLAAGYVLVHLSDFNRDGRPDYLLFNPSTRQTAIWYLNNNVFVSGRYGPTLASGYTLSGTADFNRDGKADYLLFNPSTRQTAIWYMNDYVRMNGAYGPTLPSGWSLAVTGDFNGDSKPDFVLENTSTRQTAIWYLNNNALIGGAYGPTLPGG